MPIIRARTSSPSAPSSTPASACRSTRSSQRSDLYEKPGKNPHAFCTDIDRLGDVRIVCNLKDNEQWMETTLHELGHGVYARYNSHAGALSAPHAGPHLHHRGHRHVLRPAQRQSRLDEGDAPPDRRPDERRSPAIRENAPLQATGLRPLGHGHVRLRKAALRQSRSGPQQTVVAAQEKIPVRTGPTAATRPDWAAKIHIATAPCYYHNYLLGELLASQLYNKLKADKCRARPCRPAEGRPVPPQAVSSSPARSIRGTR